MAGSQEQSTEFIPGIKLSELFYHEAVLPILKKHDLDSLPHSAGLLDSGSEVFGYDTPMSADHHWGPRLLLFLNTDDSPCFAHKISEILRDELPCSFYGYSTSFGPPDAIGVRLLENLPTPPVNHRVEIFTPVEFFKKWLNEYDPSTAEPTFGQWEAFDMQTLFAIRKGRLFHDGLNIEFVRQRLYYYPKPVWGKMLAGHWDAIGQEEAFVGRCGSVGDEIGSQLVAARIVDHLMKIAFILEKEYYPYSKWLGTAFNRLKCATVLKPQIENVFVAGDWHARENRLRTLYIEILQMHNQSGDLGELPVSVSGFHSRPFQVPHADAIAQKIRQNIFK